MRDDYFGVSEEGVEELILTSSDVGTLGDLEHPGLRGRIMI